MVHQGFDQSGLGSGAWAVFYLIAQPYSRFVLARLSFAFARSCRVVHVVVVGECSLQPFDVLLNCIVVDEGTSWVECAVDVVLVLELGFSPLMRPSNPVTICCGFGVSAQIRL